MRVVLYARVSSEKQAERDLSISAQLKALRQYAQEHGWEVYREFVDEAASARSANRPAFKEMIALGRQRRKRFDAILVWKLSRFARNREDSIIYKSLLRRRGISIISINEHVDDSPAGRLLEGMIEVIDEFYSVSLAQDTLRGMKDNARRGYLNGGTVAIGYQRKKVMDGANERATLEPDPAYSSLVQRIFRMCINGMGAKEIAKILNGERLKTKRGRPWTKNAIYYILKNEVYAGVLIWNRQSKANGYTKPNEPSGVIRIESNHPALVGRGTFDRVQCLLRERSPKIIHPRRVNSSYLLSGLVHCGKCGAAMIGCSAKSSQFFYYACHKRRAGGKDLCDARLINRDKLESLIVGQLKTRILTEENLAELVRLTNEEFGLARDEHKHAMAAIEAKIGESRERLHRLYDALETGQLGPEDLAPRIKELRAHIADLQRTRAELLERIHNAKVARLTASAIQAYVDDLQGLLSKGSILEQRSFLRSFVKRIEVNLPQVAIDYTIPLETEKAEPLTREVLSVAPYGSSGWIRTNNQPVNSRLLYR